MAFFNDNLSVFRQIKDLFPTKLTAIIFVSYMILFINQGLLITSTKSSDNHYKYDPKLIVILTEYVKLFASVAIYLKNDTFRKLLLECNMHRNVFVKYFIPAFLYCLYNNLQFTNLAQYDPATYFILLQFRVVVTGVIYQVLFSRKLTSTQWLSLFILTLGCVVKQMKISNNTATNISTLDSMFTLFSSIQLDYHLLLILIQILCSCFAGVYNEFLLKNKTSSQTNAQSQLAASARKVDVNAEEDTTLLLISTDKGVDDIANSAASQPHQNKEVPIMVQNVYMYLASILCNYAYLLLGPDPSYPSKMDSSSRPLVENSPLISTISSPLAFDQKPPSSFVSLLFHDWHIACIILNGAGIGLVTSYFLKYLDSILKNFASALEIIFTAILANLIFNIAVGPNTIVATVLVCFAVYLYSKNPVRRV